MNEFWQDLVSGEIQFRDKWQFELKSEFFPPDTKEASSYLQEFYIFVPNALQINAETYSKEEFYKNQTNLIRYKTPEFTIKQLIDPEETRSPLNRVEKAVDLPNYPEIIEDELKLLGNVFRSALRKKVLKILRSKEFNNYELENFCKEIEEFRRVFFEKEKYVFKRIDKKNLKLDFAFIDEFLSNSIDYYLTNFLAEARKFALPLNALLDQRICSIIINENSHREKILRITEKKNEKKSSKEEILYRNGLLKKFVIDALLLTINRSSIQQKYGHYIGAISAAVAMLIYLMLFIWQGQVFLINSQPFIIVTVIAYVLKDRIKEGLKTLSYERALRWFSDYTTEIKSPDEKIILGELKESFTFVNEGTIPQDVITIRNRDIDNLLESPKRAEQILYIKKMVKMFPRKETKLERRRALNIIFRFNIQDFVQKASDPFHNYIKLEPFNKQLIKTKLPKVYHVNVILKSSYKNLDGEFVQKHKKFRIIIDKNGIKQILIVKE